jgi:hypothetical protein
MGGADGPAARRVVFTPTTDRRRLTRALSHVGQTTADGTWTNFSNSAPQAKHPYS